MNLVDSCGWLAFFTDSPTAPSFAPAMGDIKQLLVSTINLYEVHKKVLRERGEDMALEITDIMRQCRVVAVDEEVAIVGARLAARHGLAMADSLILATAKTHEAILWTQDADFQGLEGVQFIQPA